MRLAPSARYMPTFAGFFVVTAFAALIASGSSDLAAQPRGARLQIRLPSEQTLWLRWYSRGSFTFSSDAGPGGKPSMGGHGFVKTLTLGDSTATSRAPLKTRPETVLRQQQTPFMVGDLRVIVRYTDDRSQMLLWVPDLSLTAAFQPRDDDGNPTVAITGAYDPATRSGGATRLPPQPERPLFRGGPEKTLWLDQSGDELHLHLVLFDE